ncbi:hypothetical protein PIB30_070369 [Stylosanthes scabra]|uniref:Uncharacterized protein n=1 Tax=Stylosanthes scabra TaxID=79078 RepID=A0ABU6TN44_9FABA|nr:hypothetical protein [Stylosanthes scabra]
MENAATYFKSSDVHEDYHYLKYRRKVSFLNCLIHHTQTDQSMHAHGTTSKQLVYFARITWRNPTPTISPSPLSLSSQPSLSLLFIVLGSANMNPWQGATGSAIVASNCTGSVAPCHGLYSPVTASVSLTHSKKKKRRGREWKQRSRWEKGSGRRRRPGAKPTPSTNRENDEGKQRERERQKQNEGEWLRDVERKELKKDKRVVRATMGKTTTAAATDFGSISCCDLLRSRRIL